MRLISLKISKAGSEIRNIVFKEGLNLILDVPTNSSTQSGNNLGKTTVLRLIDYCFGSNGSDIWEDPEFKKVNQEVYDFLHDKVPVTVTLSLESATGHKHVLERRFVVPKTKDDAAFIVDGHFERNIKDYQSAVKQVLFGSGGAKPTLRELMPKFVRSNASKMGRTLKFHTDHTTEATYEVIHLFLFGFFDVAVLEELPRLTKQLKNHTRDLQALTRIRGEGEAEQLFYHIQGEITAIQQSDALKGEIPEIAEKANVISGIRAKASGLSSSLSLIQSELDSVELALNDYKREFGEIDSKVIESIYREAHTFIPELQTKWEELSEFVHKLRSRKEQFLTTQLSYLEAQRNELLLSLSLLEAEEVERVNSLTHSPEFINALAVRSELLEKTKQLGNVEQNLKDIRFLKNAIAVTSEKIGNARKKIDDEKTTLQQRLKVFNNHFSKFSKTLYGEEYLLHAEENNGGGLSFKLSSVGANVGTGKKASQTAAFDLAYCKFLEEERIAFPKFICHDGIEAIHDNQLKELFMAAAEPGIQLIVATLRDKLPNLPIEFFEENTILELSQNDKLLGL